MQVDMHYYGTYAMARAAGLKSDIAQRIAEAAQFVDDYTEEDDIETSDGALVSYWPSGHGMVCDANFDALRLNEADPHKVWVTFHFLPGGGNASYQERMRCVKDSATAQEVIERVLERCGEAFAPELIGIMAHIYADTFSHYGFAGLRSDMNLVDRDSIKLDVKDSNILDYLENKADGFLGSIAASTTRGLGHASVADFPDRPFLKWEFTYENGVPSGLRNNQETYMSACEKLFSLFSRFKSKAPRFAEAAETRNFEEIRSIVAEILAFEGKKEARCNEWRKAAANGYLIFDGAIPEYREDNFQEELDTVKELSEIDVVNKRVWHFTRGVEVMRSMILNELLPAHGLIG